MTPPGNVSRARPYRRGLDRGIGAMAGYDRIRAGGRSGTINAQPTIALEYRPAHALPARPVQPHSLAPTAHRYPSLCAGWPTAARRGEKAYQAARDRRRTRGLTRDSSRSQPPAASTRAALVSSRPVVCAALFDKAMVAAGVRFHVGSRQRCFEEQPTGRVNR